jgi:hypothetical protein
MIINKLTGQQKTFENRELNVNCCDLRKVIWEIHFAGILQNNKNINSREIYTNYKK